MPLTLSTFLALTIVISASLFFHIAQSVPFSPDSATVSINNLAIKSEQLALDGQLEIKKTRHVKSSNNTPSAEKTFKSSSSSSALPKAKHKATNSSSSIATFSKTTNTTSKASHGSSGHFHGEGTFFSPNVGAGSCGKLYQDYEMVAALNIVQMQANWPYPAKNPNKNPLCNQRIKVTNNTDKANGASVHVKIVDTCPPCKKGDVDLSVKAFGKIAHHDTGRINITWVYED
ncbi:hypothetical protein [Parasitella parasitica]|uniref:RlpA-like protein double-psi beta-barrel domain-containing protein n=1 Tax=Parasitella parasitica TaxID=35722 RepID=A0A0B7N6Z6_9FUNG|nr:hypothetical protein [Parasitella parasitica]